MKHILLAILALFISSASFAADNIHLLIKGMHCQKCVNHLTTSFKTNDAVESISINLETRTAELQLKAKKTLSDKQIKTMVEKAGYELESIQH